MTRRCSTISVSAVRLLGRPVPNRTASRVARPTPVAGRWRCWPWPRRPWPWRACRSCAGGSCPRAVKPEHTEKAPRAIAAPFSFTHSPWRAPELAIQGRTFRWLLWMGGSSPPMRELFSTSLTPPLPPCCPRDRPTHSTSPCDSTAVGAFSPVFSGMMVALSPLMVTSSTWWPLFPPEEFAARRAQAVRRVEQPVGEELLRIACLAGWRPAECGKGRWPRPCPHRACRSGK